MTTEKVAELISGLIVSVLFGVLWAVAVNYLGGPSWACFLAFMLGQRVPGLERKP